MKPKIVKIQQTSAVIDHKATGAAAKAYREGKRIKISEVAAKLGFTEPSAVCHMESGRTKWSDVSLKKYIAVVDSIR